MLKLPEALKAWNSTGFEEALKEEVQALDNGMLPLQQGLSQSSHVSGTRINVVVLKLTETAETICAKTGIFYAGIIAGSCCSDDPTPPGENTEYCELLFEINKKTAETAVTLLQN